MQVRGADVLGVKWPAFGVAVGIVCVCHSGVCLRGRGRPLYIPAGHGRGEFFMAAFRLT